ncbi:MAG: hypothetical protein KC646_15825 [Candidatus Cloacimonetes bacterium]|nr:hypothetical protein [Candidatus Cloacimonadota bacterium]
MSNDQESANNTKELVDCLKKRLITDYENLIQHSWIHGYAVDSLKVAYYVVLLDNYFKYDIKQNYPNIAQELSSIFTVQQLADILVQNPKLTNEAVDYIGGLLESINHKVHKYEELSKIQIQLDVLTSQFIHGHYLENLDPVSEIPLHIQLKQRTLNQYHLYRWLTGKRYQSSGTNLAIVSQWIPDLEAIATVNSLINTEKIKLNEGFFPLDSLIPIGSKAAIKISSIDDFLSALVIPAKKLRLPATSNSSVVNCIETIININFVELAKNQSNLKAYQTLLDQIQSDKFKDHLFLEPFHVDHPLLPAPTDSPVDISDLGTFRNSIDQNKTESKTSKKSLTDKLLENTFELVHLFGKLKPNEIQRIFQNFKYGSEQKYKKLVDQIKNFNTTNSLDHDLDSQDKLPYLSDKPTKKAADNLKDKPSALGLKLNLSSPLNKFDDTLPNTPTRPISAELVISALESTLWATNPKEFSELVFKILHLSNNTKLDIIHINKLVQVAKETKNDQGIKSLIHVSTKCSKSLNKGQMEILNKYIQNLPEIGNLINDNHCNLEATKLIQNEKWDKLPKKDKNKLTKLANEKHLIEVAEVHMDDFLRKESLSNQDLQNLGEITSVLLQALMTFLEKSAENSQSFEELINQVKILHQKHTDKMRSKISDIDEHFITEIQNWLQELLQFVYERDEKEYLECISNIEVMFISVWKKVEQQLKDQVTKS